ncbi:hypothetical protein [Nocardia sp. XZ_19_385]|uniref:hypothetical protein n=1 Tax=Nocardia sp. XZ_19_385 TaxID=2769488 RepID=UPI00188FF643|nr:hypothetical protein [Nocardia sp. XZ_19_385]
MDIGASATIIVAAGVVGLILVIAKHWWWQAVTIAVSVVAAIAAVALEYMIQRARPPEDLAVVAAGGFSMPSTVVAMTAAVAVAAYLVLPWPARHRRGTAIRLAVLVVARVVRRRPIRWWPHPSAN